MALQTSQVPVTFFASLDTKNDPKLIQGKLLQNENGVFLKTGRVSKRNGTTLLSNTLINGGTISGSQKMGQFDNELLQFDGHNIYGYSETNDNWVNKGSAVSVQLTDETVIRNQYQQNQSDMATYNSIEVHAWSDSRGGVRASVIDTQSHKVILSDVIIDSTATACVPRCTTLGGYLFVFYCDGTGNMKARRINPVLPTGFDAAVIISNNVDTTNPAYDLALLANHIVFAHAINGSNSIRVGLVSSVPALGASTTIGDPGTGGISVHITDANKIVVTYASTLLGLSGIAFNGDLTVNAPSFSIDTGSLGIVNVSGINNNGTNYVWYEITGSIVNDHFTRLATFDDNAGSITSGSFLRSVGLATKPFVYSGSAYVGLAHDSAYQPTNFVARDDGYIVAKIAPSVAGGLRTSSSLASIVSPTDGIFKMNGTIRGAVQSDFATVFTLSGVASAQLDFTSLNRYASVQLGETLVVAGAVVSGYDGVSFNELNFHLYPELISAVTSSASGSVQPGSYEYAAVYEWMDNSGQIQRSATVPIVVDMEITGSVIVTIDTLRLTNKQNVTINLYRSQDGQTVLYKVSSKINPTYNDPTVDYVTIVDAAQDNTIASNEILYTTGGIRANVSPPAASVITTFDNRVWLAGLEDPNMLWYSNDRQQGDAVNFPTSNVMVLDPNGGPITAIASMESRLIIFKQTKIFIITGTGPNAAGQNGNYSTPFLLTADIGCTSAASLGVALTKTNSGDTTSILFDTDKGIYSLSSTLIPTYIGADVDDFNDEVITSATQVPDLNQIRFITRTGRTLVYDYFYDMWSTFTNYNGIASLNWKNTQFVYMRNDGSIYKEAPNVFNDNGQTYSMMLEIGNLSMAGISNFQRAYEMVFLGDYKSVHTLRVSTAYDFSPGYQDILIYNPQIGLGINTYGSSTPYGADERYGGTVAPYQFRHSFSRQKCEAIRIKIEDIPSAVSGSGESYTVNSLNLQVGLKKGSNKMSPAQSV